MGEQGGGGHALGEGRVRDATLNLVVCLDGELQHSRCSCLLYLLYLLYTASLRVCVSGVLKYARTGILQVRYKARCLCVLTY